MQEGQSEAGASFARIGAAWLLLLALFSSLVGTVPSAAFGENRITTASAIDRGGVLPVAGRTELSSAEPDLGGPDLDGAAATGRVPGWQLSANFAEAAPRQADSSTKVRSSGHAYKARAPPLS